VKGSDWPPRSDTPGLLLCGGLSRTTHISWYCQQITTGSWLTVSGPWYPNKIVRGTWLLVWCMLSHTWCSHWKSLNCNNYK
jgi:hypothetical protein